MRQPTKAPSDPDLRHGNIGYGATCGPKLAHEGIHPNAVTLTLDTPVNSAPKYTYSAAIAYDVHVGAGIVTPSTNARGVGRKPACQSGADYVCRLPAHALAGFRLDYAPNADGRWRIGVYGTDVFDKVSQQARTGYFGGFGINRYTAGRPAEFGLESSLRFQGMSFRATSNSGLVPLAEGLTTQSCTGLETISSKAGTSQPA